MYSARKVAARLASAEREFNFPLVYHTIAEVEEFEAHLHAKGMYTFDKQGHPNGTQNLTEYERRHILNEQILSQCDAAYWLTRYCYLIDEAGVVLRFEFRMPQKILFSIIS